MKSLASLLALIFVAGAASATEPTVASAVVPAGGSAPAGGSVDAPPPSLRESDRSPISSRGIYSPRYAVESLHTVLLSCMKEANAIGFEGRYERILAQLDESFDIPFMARTSVSAAWKQLTEQERADFIDQSRRLSAATYADNFDGFGGQHFETISEEPAARSTIIVKTRFAQPDDEDVAFNYRLRKVDDRWKIIDVQLDGKVSELTLRRADYRSVIEREGFAELVKALDKKIEMHAAAKSKSK